ncbi:MAG: flagellar biosynthetic protein FliO [Rhizobacter sp.]|nr:flagellar biosynthetic protein FliO [Rhizobacter sp.]
MPNGLSALLWFVVIVAAIPFALWLLKRTPLGTAGGAGVMKSVAMLPLSTSHRIVTVEVGSGEERRWLVLGVTPSAITTLHTMAPGTTATDASPGAMHPASFAQLFARVRGKGAGDAG